MHIVLEKLERGLWRLGVVLENGTWEDTTS
jgi:hypothetical protein